MITSIAQYNSEEALAMLDLPNNLIAAVCPKVFNLINYPTRISTQEEMWRYADVMHEGRFAKDFQELLTGSLSHPEWKNWQSIYKTLDVICPRGSLARAQYALRAIKTLIPPSATILEVGPGSGYLSFLLTEAGYYVATVENTQAFYIWQSNLWESLGVSDAILHFPWWEFYSPDPTEVLKIPVDLVVANHVISEMTTEAQMYLVRCCEAWKCQLVIDGPGLQLADHQTLSREIFKNIPVLGIEGPFPPDSQDVFLEEIEEFQRAQYGDDELRTQGERWLDTIHGTKGFRS